MGRRFLIIVFSISFLAGNTFAKDPDATAKDLKGVPKSHKYFWAVAGGTLLGAGIGVIAPGGGKSTAKGALIGGSLTSAFYLAKHPRAASGWRGLAHVGTNAALGTGILWAVCDCGDGAWAGGLIGGGGTAFFQAMGSRNRNISKWTGASAQPPPATQPAPASQPASTNQPASANQTGAAAQPAADAQTLARSQLQDPNNINPGSQDPTGSNPGNKTPAKDAPRQEPKKPPQQPQ
jgi:hypothetical protein